MVGCHPLPRGPVYETTGIYQPCRGGSSNTACRSSGAATDSAGGGLPKSPYVAEQLSADIDEGARTLGERALVFRASTDDDVVKVFSEMTEQKAGALIVAPDAFFHTRAGQIIALAMKHGIPAIFDRPDLTAAGG
jgi:hypothetical protein